MPSKTSPRPTPPRAVPATRIRPQIGMHGELVDWINSRSQLYHLGNGARSYDPMLQCFLRMDPFSPFSGGGINPYAFCGGDPVNRTDHSGYMSVSAATGLGLGIVGIILGIATLGLAMMLATLTGTILGITSALLGLASNATGIAAAIIGDHDPKLASTLGWISLGLGIASAATGLFGPALASYGKATGRILAGKMSKRAAVGYIRRVDSDVSLDYMLMPEFHDGALVMTHGEPGLMQNFGGRFVSPLRWADDLSSLPSYAESRRGPLYLLACSSATPNGNGVSNVRLITSSLAREVRTFNAPVVYVSTPFERAVVARGLGWGKLTRFPPM
ncbi:RHS repeat-associated core domain-containing protein [Microvirgula aerodenitrificans]|uniref:RHS repeat-associated core domain-containing protein n=1 Tax=Microvirgula aerodenitrificans TaxID=57480 RepID=UPI000A06036E|nr:RHS repeat-associated core domain-containing protein [Microvirgula aerodenitrificans]